MINVICSYCGKTKKTYPSLVKGRKHVFCNEACKISHIKDFPEKWNRKPPPIHIGAKNPRWNGGKTVDRYGYEKVFNPESSMSDSKGYVYTHRLVVSKSLGRILSKDEVVHHINEDKQDNRIQNLQLMTHREHKRLHASKKI